MRWLLLALVLGTFLARWFMVTMEDTSLRDDVLFAELLTGSSLGVDAESMAQQVELAARKHKCELVPGSLRVNVQDARYGQLDVQGAGMQVQGKPGMIQDIGVHFDCRRPGTFFVKSTAKFRLSTQASGSGSANEWPRPDEPEGQEQPAAAQ